MCCDACSNKDVVPIDYIDACSVGERLTLFANISSLTIMSAFAICLIFGELDPLGELRGWRGAEACKG